MNTKILGLLTGLAVVGIAFIGGASAADSGTVNELGTQDCPNCHQAVSGYAAEFVDDGCPNCPQAISADATELGTQDCPNCHQAISSPVVEFLFA